MAKNYFGISDKGRVRDNNEDTFIAEKILDNRLILACVIDGVGGYSGGEVAAQIAKDVILDHFSRSATDITTAMKEALVAVNENIQKEKQHNKDNDKMACVLTLSIVDLENNKFNYAHVGDTRLYLLRDNSLVKITKDHSFVGFLEDSGRLTEAQAMKHPKRNEINKALGFNGQIKTYDDYIETGESPFLPGDLILLCSDGLTDMVNHSEITEVLTSNKTLEEKARELVDAANNKGGKDNITVALVYHDSSRREHQATKPVKKNDNDEVDLVKGDKKTSMVDLNPQKRKKSYKGLITFFIILSLALIGTIVWLLVRQGMNGNTINEPVKLPVPISDTASTEQTAEEKRLRDSMSSMSSYTLLLTDSTYGQTITLTAPITVDRDTLYLKGSSATVINKHADYTGPAIILSPNCKYVVLDSLTLRNFDVGIVSMNNALRLRNVRFNNVRVAVQSQFSYPDNAFVTGRIKDTTTISRDTAVINKDTTRTN